MQEQYSGDAVARSIIGYCDGRRISTFTGETKGSITKELRGSYHFNRDPIFIPEGYTQTYGEMGPGMKQATSQAMKAWECFLAAVV